jgi:ferric-dicitrate binding protein FerR (iron transport regulator)
MAAQPFNQSRALEFRDATLAEVVAALNRTNTTKLVICNPELAALCLGVRSLAYDVEGFLLLLK